MAEQKKGGKKQEGTPIHLRDKVEVFSTEKDPHHKTGSAFKVHPKVAEVLVKRGMISMEPVKPAKKEAKDDLI